MPQAAAHNIVQFPTSREVRRQEVSRAGRPYMDILSQEHELREALGALFDDVTVERIVRPLIDGVGKSLARLDAALDPKGVAANG